MQEVLPVTARSFMLETSVVNQIKTPEETFTGKYLRG